VELKEELLEDYRDLLPDVPRHEMRRLRGEQEVIVRYEPEKALETLPGLLEDPADRDRLLAVFDRLLTDDRIHRDELSPEQRATLKRLREALSARAEELPRLLSKGVIS
jgi:hypothetical protein